MEGLKQMTIGQNIKRFRRNANMTQEELADMLSISSQAVSRWETDATMPDITFIPALVSIFGVSSDELLGIDSIRQQENVDRCIQEIRNLYETHQYHDMLNTARQAIRNYPNNMKLIDTLAFALTSGENAKIEGHIDEAIALYKLILEKSVDNVLRFRATAALCRLFAEHKHNKEQALYFAKQLPKGLIQTSSYLIGRYGLLNDADKESFYREQIDEYARPLLDAMYELADPNYQNPASALTVAQRIELLTQILSIQEIIYGNEPLSMHYEFYEINRIIGCLWLLDGNYEKALDCFEAALEHAKRFDAYSDDDCYTSLALYGIECDPHSLRGMTALQDMFDRLTSQDRYNAVRDQPRFINIVNTLTNN